MKKPSEKPNILVFTVSSWNSKVGSNTWATLLSDYPSENVACIYLRDETPDNPVCSRYFNISENKVLKSIFNRKIKTGTEVTARISSSETDENLAEHNARYVKMSAKRRYSMLMARELVWKVGKWKTPELDKFLDDFKPDIILHSMEGYIHLNNIIQYSVKRTGATAIGYIWDDNFTYKQYSSLGYKIYRFFQRKSLKKLSKLTTRFFAISPLTKKEADKFFNINSLLLTKPLLNSPKEHTFSGNYPIRMLYTGNLRIGRDKSLLKLSNALKSVNSSGEKIILDVYTQTALSDDFFNAVENDFCRIHKAIPQAEALQKQNEADILLFLEDVDGVHSKAARLSFSTKITDYLSTGKCIFALGNKDTAPMQYFLENDAAVVCTDSEDILNNLKALCKNTDIINIYSKNACNSALLNHNPEIIKKDFLNTLDSVLKKDE